MVSVVAMVCVVPCIPPFGTVHDVEPLVDETCNTLVYSYLCNRSLNTTDSPANILSILKPSSQQAKANVEAIANIKRISLLFDENESLKRF